MQVPLFSGQIPLPSVVGYQTTGFDQSGWMMNVGVAFSNIGAQDGAYTLDDSFFSGSSAEGDQVVTLDADVWDVNQYDKQGDGNGWVLTPADGSDPEFIQSITIGKGDFIYYIPAEATSVNIAGRVADTTSEQTITFDLDNEAGQWLFPLVNPYPVDTTWGELNTFTKEGDQIIALNADIWDVDQYDRQGDGNGWVLTPAGGGDAEFITEDAAVAIPAGGAVYYAPSETVTWTVFL